MEPDDVGTAEVPASSAGAAYPPLQPPPMRARTPSAYRRAKSLWRWAIISTAVLAVLDLLAGGCGLLLIYAVAQLSEPGPSPANWLYAVTMLSLLFFAPGVLYGVLSISIADRSRVAAALCAILAALTLVLPL